MSGSQFIKCSVDDCKYNDHSKNCTLNSISVGGTDPEVTSKYQTDCMSFECS